MEGKGCEICMIQEAHSLLSLTNLGVLSQSSSIVLTAAHTKFWKRNMNNILASISSNQNLDWSALAG